jgi:hypothetical protein
VKRGGLQCQLGLSGTTGQRSDGHTDKQRHARESDHDLIVDPSGVVVKHHLSPDPPTEAAGHQMTGQLPAMSTAGGVLPPSIS